MLKRLPVRPVFSFGFISAYSFIASTFIAVAVNLVTSLRSEVPPAASAFLLRSVAAVLFAAAIGFFVVSWQLELARDAWTAEGAPPNVLRIRECIEARLTALWVGLVVGLLCGIGAIAVLLLF